jgi:hypothetical protein
VSAVAQFGRPQYQLTTTAISSLTNEARVVLRKRAQRRQLSQSDSTFSYLLLLHHHPLVLEIDKSFSRHSLMQIKVGRKPQVADHFAALSPLSSLRPSWRASIQRGEKPIEILTFDFSEASDE